MIINLQDELQQDWNEIDPKYKETIIIQVREYDEDRFVWFDLENDCITWYLDNNYPDILYDDYPPPSIDNINERNQGPIFPTSHPLTYSPVEMLVSYPHLEFFGYGDALLDIDDSIYVDPHD